MKKRMLTILTLAAVLAVPLAAPRISSASEVTAATESMEGIAPTESTEESGAGTADEVLVGGGTLDAATGLVTPGLGSWLYETDDSAKVIYLTQYTGSYERIRVPAVYAVNGKNYAVKLKTKYYPSSSMEAGVFYRNEKIKEVQFEDGVGGDFSQLFMYCSALEKANIPSGITNCKGMFYGCSSLTEAPAIPSSVKSCVSMFELCSSLKEAPAIPSSITDCSRMFVWCFSLKEAPTIPSSVTNCYGMFGSCTSLKEAPVIPSSVTNCEGMFGGCSSLKEAPTIPSSVTNCNGMFGGCSSLTEAPVIPSSVTNCYGMFRECSSLIKAPAIPSSVGSCGEMFKGCSNLKEAPVLPSMSTCNSMFEGCSKLSGSMDIMGKVAYFTKGSRKGQYYAYFLEDMFKDAATEGSGLTIYYADGVNIDNILATKSANSKITAKPLSEKPAPTPGNSTPSGTKVAAYGNDTFYQGEDGNLRCYENGKLVTNEFKFDGSYTYYMQADGTPMKDRLTYHPDGEHIIYLDENGHEVFTNFQYCPSVGYICYFDAQGYLYKDQITFVGDKTYYLNGNGAMEQSGWFQFANGLDYGYANSDGTLVTTGFSYDPYGRVVFYHWNGMVARGLISDGAYYYSMDTNDGHYLGQFPVQ